MVHWGSESCDPPTPTTDIDGYWRSMLIESAGWVELARVTEANVEEWLWRFEFLRRMGSKDAGCLVFNARGEPKYQEIPVPVIRRWIGLWTNWSDISRHAFVKRRYEDLERACTTAVRDAIQVSDACGFAATVNGKAKPRKRRAKA
jgi:hypothetical protein